MAATAAAAAAAATMRGEGGDPRRPPPGCLESVAAGGWDITVAPSLQVLIMSLLLRRMLIVSETVEYWLSTEFFLYVAPQESTFPEVQGLRLAVVGHIGE